MRPGRDQFTEQFTEQTITSISNRRIPIGWCPSDDDGSAGEPPSEPRSLRSPQRFCKWTLVSVAAPVGEAPSAKNGCHKRGRGPAWRSDA